LYNKLRKILFAGLMSFLMMGESTITVEARIIPADSNKIQYFGRWDVQDGVYRTGMGATYIKANFTGTGLSVFLSNDENNHVWWRVSIDDGDFRRFKPHEDKTVLAEDLTPGIHKVILVRSTEGEAGISEFRGFELDPYNGLLKPEPPKQRRLEFIGDSITAGAMNEGKFTGENYYDVEDNDMAYGAQLARMLDADYSIIGKSGQGVVHNYTEPWPSNALHAADTYPFTFICDEISPENPKWDSSKFSVDAAIVSIGTNDFTDHERQPTEKEFTAGYKRLLEVIRQSNPAAAIICADPLPAWIPGEAGEWIKQTVKYFNDRGDRKVYYVAINEKKPLLSEDDYTDGETHPNKNGSRKAAKFLKDKIAAILAWK